MLCLTFYVDILLSSKNHTRNLIKGVACQKKEGKLTPLINAVCLLQIHFLMRIFSC